MIEPNLDEPGSSPQEALILGNAGQARLGHSSHGRPITRGGGRILSGQLGISDNGQGGTDTEFFILADQLFNGGDDSEGGLAFGTQAFQIGAAGSPQDGPGTFISLPTAGTLEDADGNTVFGPADDYQVLTSARRPGEAQPFDATDTGTERVLGGDDQQADGFATLATRLPGTEVVTEPLALADGQLNPAQDPVLTGFASGAAVCSTGDCGTNPGAYGLVGGANVRFGNPSGVDDNSLEFQLSLFSDGSSSQPQINQTGLTLRADADGQVAYVSDKVFGGLYIGEGVLGSDNISTSPGNPLAGAFGFASTGLVGDAGLLTDPDPGFLRWGVWSAVYDTSFEATDSEDAVPLGFFVLGAPTDASQLPAQGVARFGGDVVGTRIGTDAVRTIETGSFALAYDFELSRGLLDLTVAEFDFTSFDVNGSSDLPDVFDIAGVQNDQTLLGAGRIFSGGSDAFAAVGGEVLAFDNESGVEFVGVFGGERSDYAPDDTIAPPPPPATSTGALFTTRNGYVPFNQVAADNGQEQFGFQRGFGEFGDTGVEEVTVIVPTDASQFFQATGQNEGFFFFGTETGAPQGESNNLGPLDGQVFADLDEGFFAAGILAFENNEPNDLLPFQTGAFVSGVATAGQAAVPGLGSDFTGANVVTPLQIGSDLVLQSNVVGFDQVGDAFIVSNAGEARFTHSSHDLQANGGRIGGAAFVNGQDPEGNFTQRLSVFADTLTNDADGGLRFGDRGVSTETAFTATETGPAIDTFGVGTLEDINGDTVFGEETQRFVTSSGVRFSPDTDYVFEPVRKTLTNGQQFQGVGSVNVVTIDEAGTQVVDDPFALVLGPQTAAASQNNDALFNLPVLVGAATGRFQCGGDGGGCGTGNPAGRGQTNAYSVVGDVAFVFDGSLPNDSGTDSNGLTATFALDTDGTENINGEGVFEFAVTPANNTVYADDRTFLGVGFASDGATFFDSTGDSDNGVFSFASAGALGDTGLFPSTTPQPEYVTWGAWNASFDTADGETGAPRTDILTTGFFVAGAPADVNNLPDTGTARYDGIVAAQRQDLTTTRVDAVGGTSALTYDFGLGRGDLTLTIDQVGQPGMTEFELRDQVFASDNPAGFERFATGPNFTVEREISGQFYAGGNDPVGAVGGEFGITNNSTNVRYDGIFAADRTNTGE